MSTNDVLQLAGVAIVLVMCAVWCVNRIRRRNQRRDCNDSQTTCSGCPLHDKCSGRDSK